MYNGQWAIIIIVSMDKYCDFLRNEQYFISHCLKYCINNSTVSILMLRAQCCVYDGLCHMHKSS